MSYVFPYDSNLCNNIQRWIRAGTRGKTRLFHASIFHIHGTQVLSFFWHPLGHMDHGLRACMACQLGPPPQTHTHRITASADKTPRRSE